MVPGAPEACAVVSGAIDGCEVVGAAPGDTVVAAVPFPAPGVDCVALPPVLQFTFESEIFYLLTVQ